MMPTCPFKPGDLVVYRPSDRGHGWSMADGLIIGHTYRVASIQSESYVVVAEVIHDPPRGIHWSEFSPVVPNDHPR